MDPAPTNGTARDATARPDAKPTVAEPTVAEPTVLYCHCKYARVLPPETKGEVLQALIDSGRPFEAVADLCEMSARRDPALGRLRAAAETQGLRIAACFPRAVEGLFHAAGETLPAEGVEVVNLRDSDGNDAAERLLRRAQAS